jgi:chemotaxis protein methyltransferase CheR
MSRAQSRDRKAMSDGEFRMFAELVRAHTGLDFSSDSRFLLEARVGRRMRELQMDSYAAYHYRVRSSQPEGGELARLVDAVTNNETYFFRERRQLRALVEEIFVELQSDRRGASNVPITVWSAGCSSGEEPYSVVMLAREMGLSPSVDLRVYASDVSRSMLHRARQGVYREASFRETEPRIRQRYFTQKDDQWRISDAIKKHVHFVHMNLMDRSKIGLLGAMDVILCRNVIIYFDADGKRRAIETFRDKLKPGGHLLLGHSESLINLSSDFELRHLKNDLVYRKPYHGMSARDPWHLAAEAAIEIGDPGEEGT